MQAWNLAGPVPEDVGAGYDLLLACSSLHASASIAEALSHAFNALAPGGFLCVYEATCALPALLWGLARQCWAAADERDFALWITLQRWEALLEAAGFQKVTTIRLVGGSSSIVELIAQPLQKGSGSVQQNSSAHG